MPRLILGIHGARRRGRVAEGDGLLNRYTLSRCIEGSNPSVSAIKSPRMYDCIRRFGFRRSFRGLAGKSMLAMCSESREQTLSAGLGACFSALISCGLDEASRREFHFVTGWRALQQRCEPVKSV